MSREDDLVCAVLELLDRKTEWQASGEAQLSEPFMTAVDKCINIFDAGDTPRDCYPLRKIVDRIQKEWQEFEFYVSAVDPTPRQPFWRAVGELENAMTFAPPEIEPFAVESLQELFSSGVTDYQAAMIYSHEGIGPFLTKGPEPRPIPNLVKQERNNPGSVLPAGWVHPKILANQERAAKYENRLARRAQELRDAGAVSGSVVSEDSPAAYPVGPESIEDLIAQNVPDAQILKIKRCTIADIADVKSRLAQESMDSTESKIAEHIAKNPEMKNADVAHAVGCEVKAVASVRRRMKETAGV
jgi:hypothetical protein